MIKRHKGFALILVIWSLVILSSLATGFAYAVRLETQIAGDNVAIARAQAAGEAAMRYAVLALTWDDPDRRWEPNGQVRELTWPDARITVKVESESGRIDLNRAPRALLVGLFEQVLPDDDPDALADALLDWRDGDNDVRTKGAEAAEYKRADYQYTPANRFFTSIHELSQVMGFDRDKLEKLAPYITVHSRSPRINAVTADLVVLSSIPDITPADAAAFIEYRTAAIAAGETLRFTELNNGRRYLDTRPNYRVFALDLEVALKDGLQTREHIVLETDPARGFSVLARDPVAADKQQAVSTPDTEEAQ